MRVRVLLSTVATFLALVGCGGGGTPVTSTTGGTTGNTSTGGQQQTGGSGSGGVTSTGGTTATGGTIGTGGTTPTGGVTSSGGSTTSPATGGTLSSGGSPGTGGAGTGGLPSSGGVTGTATGGTSSGTGGATGTPTGGVRASGGAVSAGGSTGTASGGNRGTGGATSGGGGSTAATGGSTGADGGVTVNCSATMPTSGASQHSGNSQGGTGNLAWQIWSNAGSGTLTTYANATAFSAGWNNSGDYLGRMGFEWGNSGKTYDQYGTITADFAFKKNGSGGGFSYIGIYGWSGNPCVEYYILDDSMGSFPFNPYNSSQKGTATIDGETYKLFSNQTNGTGGSRCNQSSWSQFWSVRQKARQCGTITISDHFKAWDAAGMKLGNLMEAKILVETGGGSGSVDFPVANVAKTQ